MIDYKHGTIYTKGYSQHTSIVLDDGTEIEISREHDHQFQNKDYVTVIQDGDSLLIFRAQPVVVTPKQKCIACNGSGYYDSNGSPNCASCDGTGYD